MITTVLFTDIVSSTELASELGDRRWQRVLAMHHAFIRSRLQRHGGREVDTAGDGFFVTFEQPVRAVQCASEIVDGLWDRGLRVRAGVHIGEVERSGTKVGGVAVHIGSRIAATAAAGEVRVSGTLRDLISGSELRFVDRGRHELKGVPGQWSLLAVVRDLAPEGIPVRELGKLEEPAAASRSSRRRIALVSAGAVILALAAVIALAIASPAVNPGPNSVGRLDPSAARFGAVVPVGNQPGGLAYGAGSLWVLNVADQTVSRLDPASNQVTTTRAVGGTPTGIAFGAESVWIAAGFGMTSGQTGSVIEFDPATNELGRPIPLGAGIHGIAFGFGSVWVSNKNANTVTRIDPNTAGTLAVIPVGGGPERIAISDDAIWVLSTLDASVARIDPLTNTVSAAIALLHIGNAISASESGVWVASTSANALIRIDPERNAASTTIDVPAGPVAVVGLAGAAWTACSLADVVVRIDTKTNTQTAELPVQGTPWELVAGGEAIWVGVRE